MTETILTEQDYLDFERLLASEATDQNHIDALKALAKKFEDFCNPALPTPDEPDYIGDIEYEDDCDTTQIYSHHDELIAHYGKINKEEKKKCLELYQMAAKLGDIQSMIQLGDWYERGYMFCERDISKALEYYQMAADKDSPDALYRLGMIYKKKENWGKAAEYLIQAADMRVADAMLEYGHLCLQGNYYIADETEAYIWFLLAKAYGCQYTYNYIKHCESKLTRDEINSAKIKAKDLKSHLDLMIKSKVKASKECIKDGIFNVGVLHGDFSKDNVTIYIKATECLEWNLVDVESISVKYDDNGTQLKSLIVLRNYEFIVLADKQALLSLAYYNTKYVGAEKLSKLSECITKLNGGTASHINRMVKSIFPNLLTGNSSVIDKSKGYLKLNIVLENPELLPIV